MRRTGRAGIVPSSCNKQAQAPLPRPIVQVAEIVATNVPVTSEIIGLTASPQNVEVRARVEAFVDKCLFTEGTQVKEGGPAFMLHDKPIQQRPAATQASAEFRRDKNVIADKSS